MQQQTGRSKPAFSVMGLAWIILQNQCSQWGLTHMIMKCERVSCEASAGAADCIPTRRRVATFTRLSFFFLTGLWSFPCLSLLAEMLAADISVRSPDLVPFFGYFNPRLLLRVIGLPVMGLFSNFRSPTALQAITCHWDRFLGTLWFFAL